MIRDRSSKEHLERLESDEDDNESAETILPSIQEVFKYSPKDHELTKDDDNVPSKHHTHHKKHIQPDQIETTHVEKKHKRFKKESHHYQESENQTRRRSKSFEVTEDYEDHHHHTKKYEQHQHEKLIAKHERIQEKHNKKKQEFRKGDKTPEAHEKQWSGPRSSGSPKDTPGDKIDRKDTSSTDDIELLRRVQLDTTVKKTFSMHNLNDMTKLRVKVGTFNAENLYARYKFSKLSKEDCPVKGFTLDQITHDGFMDKPAKQLTAYCIQDMDADVIALQEIEGLQLLEKFKDTFLADMGYKYCIVIDGHDPRQIEVGVLSRYPIEYIRTNRHVVSENGGWLFPRDCLEVVIRVGSKLLTLYVNHFTSMANVGRNESYPRRLAQSSKVVEILETQWEHCNYKGDFIVLGDFNDYNDSECACRALIDHPSLVNVVDLLPKEERWTHYYSKERLYSQLDYLLVSKHLLSRNPDVIPTIYRRGTPQRATRFKGDRYSGVGLDSPKASDHCPISIDLIL